MFDGNFDVLFVLDAVEQLLEVQFIDVVVFEVLELMFQQSCSHLIDIKQISDMANLYSKRKEIEWLDIWGE